MTAAREEGAGPPRAERIVDLVGKLLAQAEGTDNEHEAAAFVERAQQLATEHAVDLELARSRQRQARSPEAALSQERVSMGPRGKQGNRHRVLLYTAVAAVNDVRVNVAHDSTFVLGFGHSSDLEVVDRLWASLAVQMAAAAQRRLRHGEHRAAGIAAQSWRLSFYDGYVHEVATRLRDARDRAVAHLDERRAEQAAAAAGAGDGSVEGAAAGGAARAGAPGAELVLREKRHRVDDFYARESRARGTWRGAHSGRTTFSADAQDAGRADGRRADLGQGRLEQRRRLGR